MPTGTCSGTCSGSFCLTVSVKEKDLREAWPSRCLVSEVSSGQFSQVSEQVSITWFVYKHTYLIL